MKKKNKIIIGMLVLAGCLLFGCEKRRTELFVGEIQDTADDMADDIQNNAEERQEEHIEGEDIVSGKAGETDLQSGSGESRDTVEAGSIFVHVCGAVEKPGVYELAEDARVYQAVEAAGGFLPEACSEYVNQAGMLTDGRRLYIPTVDEVRSLKETEENALMAELLLQQEDGGTETEKSTEQKDAQDEEKTSELVNINTASLSELCTLPGIGEGKAAGIISYRENTGRFEKIEDIMKVDGIKEGLFGKIRDLITAG